MSTAFYIISFSFLHVLYFKKIVRPENYKSPRIILKKVKDL